MILQPVWARSLVPLVTADLRRRYAGSALGISWALLAPTLEAVTYGVVFGLVLGVAGQPGLPYAVLIASGFFPWASFREALEGNAGVLVDNRWIRRARVPMELLVARQVLSVLPRAGVGLVVVWGYALWAGVRPSPLALVAPLVALVCQACAAYGVGLIVAPAATLVPDLRPTLASLLTLLTFASPIVYPESMARGAWAIALAWNPFTHLLRLYRSPVQPLSLGGWLTSVGVVAGVSLAAVALGRLLRARLWWRARDLL
jgi:ABC-type polysaccharide/polyol phosphate export permease